MSLFVSGNFQKEAQPYLTPRIAPKGYHFVISKGRHT